MGHTAGFHHRLYVGKVQIDHCGYRDQVADALNALPEHIIGNAEGFQHRCSFVDYLKQTVIGNDNKRIHMLLQLRNAGIRILHALFSFEVEGFGHNSDRQCSQIPCDFRHNGSSAGTGSAAHACRNEDQVGTLQRLCDFFTAFLCRAPSHFGNSSGSQAFCQLFADLDLHLRVGQVQRLAVCIDGNEFHSPQSGIHHAVYGVVSAAAAAYDLNGSEGILGFILKFDHDLSPPNVIVCGLLVFLLLIRISLRAGCGRNPSVFRRLRLQAGAAALLCQ